MMKLYGYSKWSTVRKAKAWLENNNLEFEYIDLIKNPPSKDDLKKMYEISGYEIKRFFNSNGAKYKELNMKERINTDDENTLLELLSNDGMLIKRPLLFNGKNILLGFKENEWVDILSK